MYEIALILSGLISGSTPFLTILWLEKKVSKSELNRSNYCSIVQKYKLEKKFISFFVIGFLSTLLFGILLYLTVPYIFFFYLWLAICILALLSGFSVYTNGDLSHTIISRLFVFLYVLYFTILSIRLLGLQQRFLSFLYTFILITTFVMIIYQSKEKSSDHYINQKITFYSMSLSMFLYTLVAYIFL